MLEDYYWCLVFVFFGELLNLIMCDQHSLKCEERNDVSFECPCPEEVNECRFKKLFQGGYIMMDGVLRSHHHKYQFNEHKVHITLKECNEDDEGTYVWMCGRCNVNRQFHVEVQKVSEFHVKDSDVEEMLHCFVGGDISFECPCVEELDSCGFKKHSQEGYIVRAGLLNSQHFKYELNEKRTHITLKECNEEDEGTYVWMCGRCNVNRQFHLEVKEPILETSQNTILISLLIGALVVVVSAVIFTFVWSYKRHQRRKGREDIRKRSGNCSKVLLPS